MNTQGFKNIVFYIQNDRVTFESKNLVDILIRYNKTL